MEGRHIGPEPSAPHSAAALTLAASVRRAPGHACSIWRSAPVRPSPAGSAPVRPAERYNKRAMEITITIHDDRHIRILEDITERTDDSTGKSPDAAEVTLAALRSFLNKFEQSPEEGKTGRLDPKRQTKEGCIRVINATSQPDQGPGGL